MEEAWRCAPRCLLGPEIWSRKCLAPRYRQAV